MPTTPYAKLLAAVNGGAPTAGGITAALGDTIELSGESTVGWTQQRFEISDYPSGFSCPSGWSTDSSSGAYFYATDPYPPSFTVPVWGKYLLRLIVNNGLNGAGESDPSLSDPSPTSNGVSTGPNTGTAISVASPSGLLDLGFDEGLQFSALKAWTADHKTNLRTLEAAIAPVATGPWAQKSIATTTVGGATGTALTMSVATGRATSLRLTIAADDGTYGFLYDTGPGTGITTFSGVLAINLPTPGYVSSFPLTPTFAVTWSAGTLSVTPKGPSATVTGTADNGSGKLRLTLASGTPPTVINTLTGISVTVSGLSGTPLGNGAHVATYVDATHIDLTSVNYVAADSSGTVVETTPRTVTWKIHVETL